MAKQTANPDIVKLIRRLAENPERVEVYGTAKYAFMAADFTKDDVCEAICDSIDAGESIRETTIHTIPDLKGKSAYELKPRLLGQRYYLKLALEKRHDDWLLILSIHDDY